MSEPIRCPWPKGHTDYVEYHDHEWGMPTTSDHRLFEKICLEGFQSGLSWLTVLRKRERFREVFAQFDFERVADFGPADVDRLLGDNEIIRHRGKIEATINNAQRACELRDEYGSLESWIWEWAVETPVRIDGQIPSQTPRSVAFAKELKGRGWKFFGPTTAYAFMQSEGLTNDHIEACFAYEVCHEARKIQLEGRTLRRE